MTSVLFYRVRKLGRHPLSAGLGWGQADPAGALFLRSSLQLAIRVSDSASPPALPSLLWHPAEPDLEPCPLEHYSPQSCFSFSQVDLLIMNTSITKSVPPTESTFSSHLATFGLPASLSAS